MPEFVLFGDSLTEWGFSEATQGFGRFLQQQYRYKVGIVNEEPAADMAALSAEQPEIVLFGASMTEWSFTRETHGFGWYLTDKYVGKARVVNEGIAT
ncbi:hypothetical protein ACJQWK_08157 [Exserohilum turcicum]